MKRIPFLLFICFAIQICQAQKANISSEKTELTTIPGQLSISRNNVVIGGRKIDYTATAGYAEMKNDTGKLMAKIFFIYYKKDDESAGKRPVTFAFNGGPGSSSVWLHLGA